GFIDPGFSGHVTLELSNVATLPITLWPGMKIGQLCFFRLSSPAEHPYGSDAYGSRYHGHRGPTASRSWQSFHRSGLCAGPPPAGSRAEGCSVAGADVATLGPAAPVPVRGAPRPRPGRKPA